MIIIIGSVIRLYWQNNTNTTINMNDHHNGVIIDKNNYHDNKYDNNKSKRRKLRKLSLSFIFIQTFSRVCLALGNSMQWSVRKRRYFWIQSHERKSGQTETILWLCCIFSFAFVLFFSIRLSLSLSQRFVYTRLRM